jgi:leucyl-tRNA synthetase
LQASFFDVMSAWNRYEQRCLGRVHADVWETFADAAIRLVAPVVPHVACEAWDELDNEGVAIDQPFPRVEAPEDADAVESAEDLIEQVLEDTRDIVQATGETPSVVRVFTAPEWKRSIVEEAIGLKEKGELDPGTLTGRVMQDGDIKRLGSQAADFAKDVGQDLAHGPAPDLDVDEQAVLEGAVDFLEARLDCTVEIHAAAAEDVEDGGKAARAKPGRPGIYVEA